MDHTLGIGKGAPGLPFPDPAFTVQHYIESYADLARRMAGPFPTTDANGKRRWYRFQMPTVSTLVIQKGLTTALAAAAAQAERDGAAEVEIPIPDEWSFMVRVTRGIEELEREWKRGEYEDLPVGFDSVKPHPIQARSLVEAPNHHADRDLQRALSRKTKPGIWMRNDPEGFVYAEGEHTTVIYQPGDILVPDWWKEEMRAQTLDLLDHRFRLMPADLVADVIDILFLHWYYNAKPGKAGITLAQVVKYRGKQPLPKTLELHWRAIRDARSIRLRGGPFEDIALLEIDALRPPQPNLFGLETPPASDLVYIYSPGWFVAQAVSHNAPYLAAYTARVLELDPHNHRVAKRLARYLRGEWRMNPGAYIERRPRAYRSWNEHLTDSGIDPQELFAGRKRANEVLDSLDDQILSLVRVGALRDWVPGLHRPEKLKGNWEKLSYLYHPQDRQRLLELPYHGRLTAFQTLRVHLPPPDNLDENLAHYARQQAARQAQREVLQREAAVRKAAGVLPRKKKAP